MSLERRQFISAEIERLHNLTGIKVLVLVGYAGIPRSTWEDWQRRKDEETKHNNNLPRKSWLTPEERAVIAAYCARNLDRGYRVLAWEMVDANIAFASPSSVYNVIKRCNLVKKWLAATETEKRGFEQPEAVHEQWHIDFSYIRVCGNYYYFVSILDGYSRRILNWRLCENMEGINAELLLAETRELYPEAVNPRLISDNGGQFTSKDFTELIGLLEMEQTFTSAGHPQSNGKLERFHRTFKTEHARVTAYTSYNDAKIRMAKWIAYYNSIRLHSAISYLTPDDMFYGR
jgi:transposase InsO family protein